MNSRLNTLLTPSLLIEPIRTSMLLSRKRLIFSEVPARPYLAVIKNRHLGLHDELHNLHAGTTINHAAMQAADTAPLL